MALILLKIRILFINKKISLPHFYWNYYFLVQDEGSKTYGTILESNHKCFLLKSAGEIKSIRRIQNLVIFTYFTALKFKYEQMNIQYKTLKILIRLDKPEDTKQIMSLLFETDPWALLFKLLQNHIIILDCNSKWEKIMDLENAHLHAYLLWELIKPTANENQENDYYPLPFIYPMYMLRFKKKM